MRFASEIMIGDKRIAIDQPAYFIADIAANHDGDLQRAKDLICLAKEAGADCAKFQHFKAEQIVSDFGFKNLNQQQSHQAKWKKSVFDVYKHYECRRSWTSELVMTAKAVGIELMTTPYDAEAVSLLDPHVHAYKIGSGDITWSDFIEFIAGKAKPVLLACGASDIYDVRRAIDCITKFSKDLVLMQCNTNYTASLDNFRHINLNVLRSFALMYPGILLGLSDHTSGHATVLGAITIGARVIEKHFTDDNGREGPDHTFAMDPKSWKEMTDRTRELELALGDGLKRVEQNEEDTVVIQRRCIRTTRDIAVGSILAAGDVEVLRPAPTDSVKPYELNRIFGKVLKVARLKGDYLRYGDFDA